MNHKIIVVVKKTISLSILLIITLAPMIYGYIRYYLDRNWNAIWLSWSSDPETTITISWHWGENRSGYIIIWNATFRRIIDIENKSKLFHVMITGLASNSKYNYVIGYYENGQMYNWSKIYRFRTAPPIGGAFRVLIHADTHAPSYGAFRRFISVAKQEEYDFIIHCGDMVDMGHEMNWAAFLTGEMKIASCHPLMAIAGNHEVMRGEKENYRKYMALPGREYWYYFTYSNVMFVALYVADYENFVFPEEEKSMFMEAMEYAESNNLWKIVLLHIPPFDIIPHHTHPDIPKTILPLLNMYKPDLVLMGHDHAYARLYINGTQYVILGPTGGIPNFAIYDDSLVECYAFGYGYAIMEVRDNELVFQYKDFGGKIIDEFVIRK